MGPARRNGEALLIIDSVNPLKQPRKAWQYLPGQRRTRLAPDLAYDTPNPGAAGTGTYDDVSVFNGAMDRYDWKLIGKKEMYVPYSNYRLTYHKPVSDITKANHLNPDLVRWELHRVWVVEGTLKPDKRHIYSKRTFYLDEDSWTALASDQYDARGQLYRSSFAFQSQSYDVQAPFDTTFAIYDFTSGAYNITGLFGSYDGLQSVVRAEQSGDVVHARGEVVDRERVAERRLHVVARRLEREARAVELAARVVLVGRERRPAVLVEVERALAVDVALAGLQRRLRRPTRDAAPSARGRD